MSDRCRAMYLTNPPVRLQVRHARFQNLFPTHSMSKFQLFEDGVQVRARALKYTYARGADAQLQSKSFPCSNQHEIQKEIDLIEN